MTAINLKQVAELIALALINHVLTVNLSELIVVPECFSLLRHQVLIPVVMALDDEPLDAAEVLIFGGTVCTLTPLRKDEIPDPCDWIEEHRSLAHMASTLSDLNQTSEDGLQQSEDFSYKPEGELVIDRNTREYLKANCGDHDWQYVRNYLSINNI